MYAIIEERISRILNQWKNESGVNEIIRFKYDYHTGNLTIYTSRIGFMIGKAGVIYNKYKEILKEELLQFGEIEFIEVSSYGA